jgi:hypothetical protein
MSVYRSLRSRHLCCLLLAGCCLLIAACGTKASPVVIIVTATPSPLTTPTVSAIPTEPASQEVVACSLVTQAEVEAILGEPAGAPQDMGGGCAFNNASNQLYAVSIAAGQGAQTDGILQGQAMLVGMAGAPLDDATRTRLQALSGVQDFSGFIGELVTLAKGAPAVKAQQIEGLGDSAYWAWITADTRRQGAFLEARGPTLVNINLVVPDTRSEDAMLEASRVLAEAIFARLPARFTIAGAAPAPTQEATALPPPLVTETPTTEANTPQPPEPSATPSPIPPTPTHTRTPTPTATPTATPTPPPDLKWTEVPGEGTTDARVAAVTFHNRIYLFSRGINNGRIYVNSSANAATWTGAREVPGGGEADAALWALVYNDRLYLFGKGVIDQRIYVNSTGDGTTWTGWSEVPGGGLTDMPVAGTAFDNRLYLFVKGVNIQYIYFNSMGGQGNWKSWAKVPPGTGLTDSALAASELNGNLYLFARGIDSRIYLNKTSDGSSWTGWKVTPGSGTTNTTVAVVSLADGLYLFSKGIGDKRIYMNYTPGGSNWTGAAPVPGQRTTNSAPAVTALNGKIYLFVRGIDDNKIYMMPGLEAIK